MDLIQRALDTLERADDLDVCFYGDCIVDEYRYCQPLGRSPKESLIPVRWASSEEFRGGVEAAANHARTLCRSVTIRSMKAGTRKVRFVELPYFRKVFEYQCAEPPLGADPIGFPSQPHILIITDFGHGELSQKDRDDLCISDLRFAVNAQTNAANYGFNPITNYSRADYIVIDEPEARLAAHDRESPIEAVIEQLAHNRCRKFIVTRGTNGAIGYDGSRFYHQRAFTDHVVDTMGAGDAFFAVTAPLSIAASIEELLLIGNAAGAIKCNIIGHRSSVTKAMLIQFLEDLR